MKTATARSNKGRITRSDQAWNAAHREAVERGRIQDIDEAHSDALREPDGEPDNEHGTRCAQRFYGASECTCGVADESTGTQLVTLDEPQSPTLAETVPTTQPLTVPLKFVSAALITAGKDDIRYYLNSVYIHAVDGELRICSTDGHRMIVSRFVPDGQTMPEWAEAGILIPRDDLTQALPILTKNATLYRGDCSEPCLVIEYAADAPAMTLRSANGFATFRVTPIDGKFPDYAKVLAGTGATLARGDGEALSTAAISTPYLRSAADVAGKLGAKAIHSFVGNAGAANLFTFDGAPDTVLIIMSMRTDTAVPDGVVKILGKDAMTLSIIALKAHVTRTTKLLTSANGERERNDLEARKSGFEERIAHLIQLTAQGPKRIEHREAA